MQINNAILTPVISSDAVATLPQSGGEDFLVLLEGLMSSISSNQVGAVKAGLIHPDGIFSLQGGNDGENTGDKADKTQGDQNLKIAQQGIAGILLAMNTTGAVLLQTAKTQAQNPQTINESVTQTAKETITSATVLTWPQIDTAKTQAQTPQAINVSVTQTAKETITSATVLTWPQIDTANIMQPVITQQQVTQNSTSPVNQGSLTGEKASFNGTLSQLSGQDVEPSVDKAVDTGKAEKIIQVDGEQSIPALIATAQSGDSQMRTGKTSEQVVPISSQILQSTKENAVITQDVLSQVNIQVPSVQPQAQVTSQLITQLAGESLQDTQQTVSVKLKQTDVNLVHVLASKAEDNVSSGIVSINMQPLEPKTQAQNYSTETSDDKSGFQKEDKPKTEVTSNVISIADFKTQMAASTQDIKHTKLDTVDIAHQLSQAVKTAADTGRSEIHLHLSPEELGGINVKIVSQDGVLSLQITADSRNTGEMLASNLGELSRSMQQNGVSMNKTEIFYASTGGYDSSQSSSARQQQENKPQHMPSWVPVMEKTPSGSVAPAQTGRMSIFA